MLADNRGYSVFHFIPSSGGVYSDQLRPSVCLSVCLSYATRYLKTHCSSQLLINKACVSYGSPHLKRLLSRSVDTPIFSEFFNFDFYFPIGHNISETVLSQHVFPHLITNYGYDLLFFCFYEFFNFIFNFAMRHYWGTAYLFDTGWVYLRVLYGVQLLTSKESTD